MLSPGTILQNRYRIVRELGRGGMGAVYEAIDQRLTSKVALKEMLGARDVHARNAFEREAALLANLNHQNLPRVTDHFSENDGSHLVMQFIEGMDLAEWFDLRGNAFPQAQVLQWADVLLNVLEYLHSHNPPILHRDIKPSNIKRTEDGRIFLLDFGLAKGSLGQMPTYENSRSIRGGTPYYSPLEQFSGPGTDARSDLYALSATLYHLISGGLPAAAGSRQQAIEDEEPDPLRPLTDFASPSVAAVIERGMRPSRKHRFGNATEMRRALKHAAEEDELSSLKDEYRRAQERRRRRDEEKKKAEEEAARQAEQERELQEANTRRKDALEYQKAGVLRHERFERERREEDVRPKVEAGGEEARIGAKEIIKEERAKLPSSIPAPVPPTNPTEASVRVDTPRPAITTIPGPPPQQLQTARDPTAFAIDETTATSSPVIRRSFLIVAGIVSLVFVMGAIYLWSQRGNPSQHSITSGQTQPVAIPQSSVTGKELPPENKPTTGMVYVPGGTFMMGRDDGDEYERPAHQVEVKPFFIDIYEVTNEDYAEFVKATNRLPPRAWTSGTYPTGAARKPVTDVNWDDAAAYASWAGKQLPTEEEWEFTARGGEKGFRYPWGDVWKDGVANVNSQSLAEVGSYKGTTLFGTFDMVGNAWEWTRSNLTAYKKGQPLHNKPSGDLRVIRGGSYIEDKNEATTTYRRGYPIRGAGYDKTGFRCVKDVTDASGQN